MRDRTHLNARGVISIYTLDTNGKHELLTRNNTILANAVNLVASIMAGVTSSNITFIRVYNGVTLKSNGLITAVSKPTVNSVKFESLFTTTSFSGNFDNCKLGPSDPITDGNFAEGTFAVQNKLNTEQLLVTWEITFDVPL
jgi:hypothetical protein